MKYILASLCILGFAQNAAAQMRDYSLSPTQTMQQPDVTRTPDGYQSYTPSSNYRPPTQSSTSFYDNPPPGVAGDAGEEARPRGNFMDIFCDPNNRPLAGTAQMQSCIEATRQSACQTFDRLPPDVQRVLDHEIGCIHSGADADGNQADDPTCTNDDHRRLVLIKKYWRDQDTAYALIFLPDKVVNGSAECVHSNGGY